MLKSSQTAVILIDTIMVGLHSLMVLDWDTVPVSITIQSTSPTIICPISMYLEVNISHWTTQRLKILIGNVFKVLFYRMPSRPLEGLQRKRQPLHMPWLRIWSLVPKERSWYCWKRQCINNQMYLSSWFWSYCLRYSPQWLGSWPWPELRNSVEPSDCTK